MSPRDKSDRDAILARRRLFVTSALASIAVSQTRCDTVFKPCLEMSIDSGATSPTICLSPPMPPPDASVSIVTNTDASADAGAGDAEPRPCLSVALPPPDAGRDAGKVNIAPPTPPRPCLSPPPIPQPCLKPMSGPKQ